VPEADGSITAIDNSTGDAWTEPFDRLVIALLWLSGSGLTADEARETWAKIKSEAK
jgi:hypothetical protein